MLFFEEGYFMDTKIYQHEGEPVEVLPPDPNAGALVKLKHYIVRLGQPNGPVRIVTQATNHKDAIAKAAQAAGVPVHSATSVQKIKYSALKKILGLLAAFLVLTNASVAGQVTEYAPESLLSFKQGFEKTEAGDWLGALTNLNRAIAIQPCGGYYYTRAKVKVHLQDLAGALADLNQSIALDSTNATNFCARGEVKFNQGDLPGALADLEQFLKMDPTNASNFQVRAWLLEQKGDWAGALTNLDVAISRLQPPAPEAVELLTRRALVKIKFGDADGALADCSHALELKPNCSDVYLVRGMARQQQRNWLALGDYAKAIELNPSNAVAYYYRAIMRDSKGETNLAAQDRQRARELDPKLAQK
jgi:tetratricopeptide (TPR) repeat protein